MHNHMKKFHTYIPDGSGVGVTEGAPVTMVLSTDNNTDVVLKELTAEV